MADAGYDRNVFINCPFDEQYRPLFEGIVFSVMIAGFRPRCALEASNAGQFRLEKIMGLVASCKYGVHDISRTESNPKGLPRFNMPLELGLDLGCREYAADQSAKRLLIMDRSKHRYQEFISDISGQDIMAHGNRPKTVIRVVRDWLRAESGEETIPGGDYMHRRYLVFREELPALRRRLRLDLRRLPFVDLAKAMRTWLEENEQ
jgi:hypothetical protein